MNQLMEKGEKASWKKLEAKIRKKLERAKLLPLPKLLCKGDSITAFVGV